ncbi:MAG: hypothetical protein J6D47_09795 [Peptostreptococcaceae bacterium]|nr:hypothetical protein [Peptostreptococcaceae bacterium]
MANMSSEQYTKTYTTFGGSDITATFNGKVIGELQAITYSITREKVPVYTMGSAEPRSFSRGKRGIAGNLVFVTFNRDALLEELSDGPEIQKYQANEFQRTNGESGPMQFTSIEEWDAHMSNLAGGGANSNGTTGKTPADLVSKYKARYADELLPFDITITFANEYGNMASTVLYGVELLNEGTGYSIDAPTSERAYTFVCRSVETMKKLDDTYKGFISTTW